VGKGGGVGGGGLQFKQQNLNLLGRSSHLHLPDRTREYAQGGEWKEGKADLGRQTWSAHGGDWVHCSGLLHCVSTHLCVWWPRTAQWPHCMLQPPAGGGLELWLGHVHLADMPAKKFKLKSECF